MAEILLFHHALGLTPGCLAFADALREAGHVVHTPDLYEGKTFETIDDGVHHAKEVGFETIVERGVRAAEGLTDGLVYAGFSLGVLPAEKLAMTRPGARGALCFHSCAPPAELGGTWPDGLPMQIHTMERDEWGDLDASREIAASIPAAELFLYPGDGHLFTDRSGPDYDEAAAALAMKRALAFLDTLD